MHLATTHSGDFYAAAPIGQLGAGLPPLAGAGGRPAIQRLLVRAERECARGSYSRAIRALEQAVRAGADEYACALHIAYNHWMAEELEGAMAAATRALALAPDPTLALEVMLNLALAAGDAKRIRSTTRDLLKRKPLHLQAHTAMGALYMQEGDVDAALRVVNTLIRIDPDCAAHQFKKGLLTQHKGAVEAAMSAFAAALDLEPDGPYSCAAREALENLDAYQVDLLLMLAADDAVFRMGLVRDPEEAAEERGFHLTPGGYRLVGALASQFTLGPPYPCRLMKVH